MCFRLWLLSRRRLQPSSLLLLLVQFCSSHPFLKVFSIYQTWVASKNRCWLVDLSLFKSLGMFLIQQHFVSEIQNSQPDWHTSYINLILPALPDQFSVNRWLAFWKVVTLEHCNVHCVWTFKVQEKSIEHKTLNGSQCFRFETNVARWTSETFLIVILVI